MALRLAVGPSSSTRSSHRPTRTLRSLRVLPTGSPHPGSTHSGWHAGSQCVSERRPLRPSTSGSSRSQPPRDGHAVASFARRLPLRRNVTLAVEHRGQHHDDLAVSKHDAPSGSSRSPTTTPPRGSTRASISSSNRLPAWGTADSVRMPFKCHCKFQVGGILAGFRLATTACLVRFYTCNFVSNSY